MKDFVGSIIEKDLTLAESLIKERIAEITQAKLHEMKKIVSAKLSENETINEVSKKLAIRAYAHSADSEEGYDGKDATDRAIVRTDNLKRMIKKKFGDKTAAHAEKAAETLVSGRPERGAYGHDFLKSKERVFKDMAPENTKKGKQQRRNYMKSNKGNYSFNKASKDKVNEEELFEQGMLSSGNVMSPTGEVMKQSLMKKRRGLTERKHK